MSAFERLRMMITMMKMRARGIRMVKCHAALERVFEYLDGELDAGTAAQVGAHFDICKECYPRYQYEKSFLETLRGHPARRICPTGAARASPHADSRGRLSASSSKRPAPEVVRLAGDFFFSQLLCRSPRWRRAAAKR